MVICFAFLLSASKTSEDVAVQMDVSAVERMGFRIVEICGNIISESFCERVLSAANIIMTKKNVRLGQDKLEQLVVLRMNADFMSYMRTHHADALKEKFKMTVLSEADLTCELEEPQPETQMAADD